MHSKPGNLTACALAALLAACGGSEVDSGVTPACSFYDQPVATFARDEASVDPILTDPLITARLGVAHYVVYPRHLTTLRPELFVFLPGTGASPAQQAWLALGAALVGYRVVSIAYINDQTALERCTTAGFGSDPACSFDVNRENQTGEDTSSVIGVSRANSIDNRVLKLLQYLHQQAPMQGWDAYTGGGQVDWSRVVIAGHGVGSGQAVFITHQRNVARAIFFSDAGAAMLDANGSKIVNAPWALEARKTPAARMHALYHANEAAAARNPEVFTALGLTAFGPVVEVDQSAPPYACSHTLAINPPASDERQAHDSVALDSAMPKDANGFPLYARAYLYLMTLAARP